MGQLNAQMPPLIQHILEFCSRMLHLAALIYDSSELEILDNGEERGLELKWIWKMGNRKKEQIRNQNFVSKTCIILTMPLKDKGRPSYFYPQLWKSNWAVPTTINKLTRQTVMKELLFDFGKFQTWLSDKAPDSSWGSCWNWKATLSLGKQSGYNLWNGPKTKELSREGAQEIYIELLQAFFPLDSEV